MEEPEVIGFMIEGENIIVVNPCTIPIQMLKEALKIKPKKGEVTVIGGLQIRLPLPKLRSKGK